MPPAPPPHPGGPRSALPPGRPGRNGPGSAQPAAGALALEPAPPRDETLWTALILILFGLVALAARLPWLFAGGPVLIFLAYLARARLGYFLVRDQLVIRTLAGLRRVPLEEVRRAEYLELGGGLRLLAVYVPGYAVGWFYLSGLGRQQLLGSTDRGEAVRLHLQGGGSLIITPRDAVGALAALQQRGVALDAPRWILREVRRRRATGPGPERSEPAP